MVSLLSQLQRVRHVLLQHGLHLFSKVEVCLRNVDLGC
jgi:hypothetical protein